MGTLKPGASYIYESPDGGKTVYAREQGTTEKILIGYTFDTEKVNSLSEEDFLWREIRKAAAENTALHNALEQCKIIYYLNKQKTPPILWHPV